MKSTIQWLGGAGYLIEYAGVRLGIDLYLSNACMGANGSFKRMIPQPVDPMTLCMDYLIASHEHGDHLDRGNLTAWFDQNEKLRLIGTCDALSAAQAYVQEDCFIRLDRGDTVRLTEEIALHGVFCDHAAQAPTAIGVIFRLGNKRIYFVGDTCYRPDLKALTGVDSPDIMLVPINSAYGNPGADGAAALTELFNPKFVLPCHYWLFKEHGGDPAAFETACAKRGISEKCRILAVGETMGF